MMTYPGTTRAPLRRGFTLLELLIVVAILAVLSVVVVPELTRAAGDDQEARLVGALQTVRAQLELYRTQHGGEYPCGDPAGPVNAEVFMRRLTTRTTAAHRADGPCGPYLVALPVNPYNQKNTVRYVRPGQPKGANQAGWAFDLDAGVLYSDDPGVTADGAVRHCDY